MKNGFTFVELLLTAVLLGLLMMWIVPSYLRTVQKEHKTQQTVLDQARAVQQMLNTRGQMQQQQLDDLNGSLQKVRVPLQRATPGKRN